MTVITLICTDRGQHEPQKVDVYYVTAPLAPDWTPPMWVTHADYELACERRLGGCGRSPRPALDELRQIVGTLAAQDTPAPFDVSYVLSW